MNTLPRTSGIYKITCTANGKIYIGSSKNIKHRWATHQSELRSSRHPNRMLQFAWDKYGEDRFVVDVIELVGVEFILQREQYWFEALNPFAPSGFNANKTADKPPSPKGRVVSTETKEKISAAKLGKGNPKLKGRRHTEDEISKISQSKIGKKRKPFDAEWRRKLGDATRGKPLSEEMRQKVSVGNTGKVRTEEMRENTSRVKTKYHFIATSPEGVEMYAFSLPVFCREQGLHESAMRGVANGRYKQYRGWKCRYA